LSSIKKGGVKDTHDMIDMVEEKLKATGKKIEG